MRSDITSMRTRTGKLIALCLFLVVYSMASCESSCSRSSPDNKVTDNPIVPLPENLSSTDKMENVDFSRFKHDSARHSEMPCLLCHQQKDELNRPQYASHVTCSGCHTQQFADTGHQICSTCHTGPNTSEMKPFPGISAFRTRFDHAGHISLGSCSTCHTGQGAGMTVPSGSDAHASCLTCHAPDKVVGEKNIGSCSTCHEPGPAKRIIDSTASIGFNFTHASHSGVSCDNCHHPVGMNKMSVITVSEHRGQANSCATCHNSKRAFGPSRMNDCRRCHTELPSSSRFGVQFSHAVHAKASCASCHKAGSANFTVPNGQNAHTTCFQCHAEGKEAASKNSCFACHQIGGGTDIKPSRAVVPGNFVHSKHEVLVCDSCHTAAGRNMTAPSVRMHKIKGSGTTCATCHDDQGAFGEEFANCKRCHTDGKFGR